MAIKFDLSIINNNLDSLKGKEEKLNYLRDSLFELEKNKSEMEFSDRHNLTRLIEKTKSDYEKYMNEFDKGGLIYLPNNNTKMDEILSQMHGFDNIDLLKKRISLETKFDLVDAKIHLFKSYIEKEQIEIKSEIEQQQIKHLNTLQEHYKPLWEEIKKQVNNIKNPLAKITFLHEKEHEYMTEVITTPELLNASGSHISHASPMKIGMDALIELEIKRIKLMHGVKETINIETALNQQQPNKSFALREKIEFESILNWLQDEGYLNKSVSLVNFKRIFNSHKITEITTINWQGTSIASLRYFIKLFPIKVDTNKILFQITANCFTCNSKEITAIQLDNAKEKLSKDHQRKLDKLKNSYLLPKK